jgi:hypothetical protein
MKAFLNRLWPIVALAILSASVLTFWACPSTDHATLKKKPAALWLLEDSGSLEDEALQAGRTAESFPAADEDYFKGMDQDAELTVDEAKGRNNWIVWTGGNDRFWDWLSQYTFGNFDLLKVLSSHPELTNYSRDNRWYWFGLVNEPGFEKWTPPEGCDYRTESCGDPDKYGLWLDQRVLAEPDPFENEEKYPGVRIGARGRNVPVGSFYGKGSGIVGLRLFTNPYFDEEAAAKWDPVRYYTDEAYYTDPDLVRPYRVGMSCGFCHVGPSPIHPPEDFENPEWTDLNSNPGAQYYWFDRVFLWQADDANFVTQWYKTYLPGTLDTSLVSSDNINNPRTMNAVYSVPARLEAAKRWHREVLAGGGLDNKQFSDYPQFASLGMFEPPDTVFTPLVLKDGADSVGVLGALNRVYVNIGLFSEEWLTHFLPVVGGKKITPFPIDVAQENSTYWNATTDQTPFLAAFFLKTGKPDYLKDAPGGPDYLTEDPAVLDRGKTVFAENCARCHSSKQPPVLCASRDDCPEGGVVEKSAEHVEWLRTEVAKPDFLENNFLSTERRIPVTELGTNICSPLATNAIANDVWDNFSSQTYKDLPSVGTVTLHHPLDGSTFEFEMPAGGRGYTRVPSLLSIWSTAPFLLNNALGKFRWEGTVEARMDSFNDSIEKLLWPEKRERDSILGDKVPGYIQRTTETSYLKLPPGALPAFLRDEVGDLDVGPIPTGTPVNLLVNLDVTRTGDLGDDLERKAKLVRLVVKMIKDLKEVRGKTEEEAKEVFKNLVPDLLGLSKCPDFVVNKGHYFGTDLPDEDKRALIEFLKHM